MGTKDSEIFSKRADHTGNRGQYLESARSPLSRSFPNSTTPVPAEPRREGNFSVIRTDLELDRYTRDNNALLTNRFDRSATKKFTMSLRNPNGLSVENSQLTFIINPSDMNYGSTQMTDTQYTRNGWVANLWGRSQSTLTISGVSPAFITLNEGLSSTSIQNVVQVSRKDSLGYAHLLNLVAFFKSNGANFLNGLEDKMGAPDDKTRVIHVLDNVVITYDGTQYEGSFSSFTLDESADNPFRFSYSFEFVISGLAGDKYQGHLNDGVNKDSGIVMASQGSEIQTVFGLDKAKLQDVAVTQQELTDLAKARAAAVDGLGCSNNVENWKSGDVVDGTFQPNPRNMDGSFVVKVKSSVNVTVQLSNGIKSQKVISFMSALYDGSSPASGINSYAEGNRPVITSGLRTKAEQEALQAANASAKKPGVVATNSLHLLGKALDIRTSNLDCDSIQKILGLARSKGLRAIYHASPLNHIHVEDNS